MVEHDLRGAFLRTHHFLAADGAMGNWLRCEEDEEE